MTDPSEPREGWRRCSTCKDWIGFGAGYVRCNVSTCNRKNTGFVFCSVPCWDAHLPTMNHRQAWAEDDRAPGRAEWAREQVADAESPREPKRIFVSNERSPASAAGKRGEAPQEILVIASRLKNYIKARSGMNTSDGVLEPLSDILRELCDDAIDEARRNERRTVLERDVPSRK